ncbi:MAG: hypothetical protein DLM73_14955 [Chthoniobacterales bacterium]|nr:MAG: hypothetical protein DLM73_14955 [Chthoniobacterales bacterium]
MKLLRSLLLILCAGLAVNAARATTVIPPSFDQLVSQAELIFQGTVTETRPQWTGEGAERHIVTYVTFKIEDSIKGAAGDTYTIRMFGGTVDGHTMEATDTPRFKVGDRDILFVENNGTQFVPLVGIMHGRFHIQDQGGGVETVAKDSGAPMSDVTKLGQDEAAAVSGKALTTADFKAAIRQKLAQIAAVK